jgi:hypothetical protein
MVHLGWGIVSAEKDHCTINPLFYFEWNLQLPRCPINNEVSGTWLGLGKCQRSRLFDLLS